ncbi:transcription-repair coupling factor [Adhaeribacter radiodurans]|uniref:Transcription-repair-coupling factor n=1 Tax=Adhaeribacter radiodurans TaxID=2745197 RepID=A0A7L7LCP7_9BACT|nr:transcription-repair coupling factor [Adhaeribacter radiodurans]QMU30591.1 transcription-repair coupling factor [Adhaeribacter radiodurans]
MKIKDFLELYRLDPVVQTIAERLKSPEKAHLHLKGLAGSLDAVMAVAVSSLQPGHHVCVLHDKEEAAYFLSDLQHLFNGKQEALLFPSSYKRPYSFDETENANILMRAEVLNQISNKAAAGLLIVAYPEALTEKVINKKSLVANTFSAKVGEKLDVNFLSEVLTEYDFERTDFVYEAGQFAVRGGIVDVFSYANELPYRVELFGDEIESIRTFNPNTQLSVETQNSVSIVPNVQTKLLQETRESFLEFLPSNTRLWFKDVRHAIDIIDESFTKAEQAFEYLMLTSGNTKVVSKPEDLFESGKSFKKLLEPFTTVEFGKRFHFKASETITFNTKPQPSFNKDFNLLVSNLHDNQTNGFTNIIAADSPRQIDRLTTIFDELDHAVKFQALTISLREGFIDDQVKVALYTDHQLFERFYKYKSKERFSKSKALTLKELRSLQPGDYVVHVDNGIGRFAGLEKVEVGGKMQEAIRLVYRDDDLLYVSIHALHKISKYTGQEGTPPSMSKLGSPEWENKKKRVKSKVKDIATELIKLYAKRKSAPGFAFSRDGFMQAELESSFIYEDTPDQAKATEDVKNDMEQPHPMDRLVCGDVGFGKTEVAIRAAFKAATDSKQVAVLVPTTILAMQHYKTFRDRLEKFPVNVEFVNRFKTAKDIKETLQRVAEGKTDILIGTHRIVSKDVKFKNLGLMVIDEEQKFGVKTKEKLKEMRVNVDSLTLSATPIPRTLHFSLMGARDLSVIATPPPNRQPVQTELHVFDQTIIRDAVMYELKRGGQVFFVHNRVADLDEMANLILKLVPDARITFAHGQMDGEQLEKRMMKFVEGEFDVLVSTNIIESGLDIPNANTIIINRAHMFGLSDLHQMRGRVGRSNKKAYCYLLTPPVSSLPSDARKRLSTLEEFSDLGDGFKVAMRDLDIRGAGNLLGGEQSGFINDLGFEMYHQILDDTIKELKETEFRDLFLGSEKDLNQFLDVVRECTVETDLEILIPDTYVSNISERLNLYSKLDRVKDLPALEKIQKGIIDRFGPLPESVEKLIQIVKLRWKAQEVGFEKLTIKKEVMKGYISSVNNDKYFQSETFGHILKYVQQHPRQSRLKETKDKLIVIFDNIKSVNAACDVFEQLTESIKH